LVDPQKTRYSADAGLVFLSLAAPIAKGGTGSRDRWGHIQLSVDEAAGLGLTNFDAEGKFLGPTVNGKADPTRPMEVFVKDVTPPESETPSIEVASEPAAAPRPAPVVREPLELLELDELPVAAERPSPARRVSDGTVFRQAVKVGTPLTAVGAMLMRGFEGTARAEGMATKAVETVAAQDPGFWSEAGRAVSEYGSQYGPVAGIVLGGALVLLGAKHFLRPSHAPIAPPDSSPSPPPQPKPDAAQPQASPASPQKGDPLARSGTHLVSPFAETLPAGLAATMGPRTGAVTPERGLRLLLTGTGN
jgi:hypothetical protein